MPDISPIVGDLVEILIKRAGADPAVAVARIMTRDTSGKWQVELSGDPPMRGLIQSEHYKWSQEGRCWQRRDDIKAPTVPVIAKAQELRRLAESAGG